MVYLFFYTLPFFFGGNAYIYNGLALCSNDIRSFPAFNGSYIYGYPILGIIESKELLNYMRKAQYGTDPFFRRQARVRGLPFYGNYKFANPFSLGLYLSIRAKRRFQYQGAACLFRLLNNKRMRFFASYLLIRIYKENRLNGSFFTHILDSPQCKDHHAETRLHIVNTGPENIILLNFKRHFLNSALIPYGIAMSDDQLHGLTGIEVFRFAEQVPGRILAIDMFNPVIKMFKFFGNQRVDGRETVRVIRRCFLFYEGLQYGQEVLLMII